MAVSRRQFLKTAAVSLGGLVALQGLPAPVQAAAPRSEAVESASMLYDTTKCVGCRACQMACKRREDRPLPPETSGLYETPMDLSAKTWTLIKAYQSEDKQTHSFVKVNCMHCIEPACVAACPVGALEKLPTGPVIYHADKCIGCRYCMNACPYKVPKYQWEKAYPLIQKCDFCAARLEKGQQPACTEVCPTGAVIYGKRGKLLEDAKSRIKASPNKYVNYVYGENEAGGAAALYLSHVPFQKLGLPEIDLDSIPARAWPYLVAVPGIIVGVGSLMTAIYKINQRKEKEEEAGK